MLLRAKWSTDLKYGPWGMFTRVTLSMASRLTFNKTPIKLNLEVMLRVTRVNIPQYSSVQYRIVQ